MLFLRPWDFINYHVCNIISPYYIHTYTGHTLTYTHLFYFIMFPLAFGAKEKLIMSMFIWDMYGLASGWNLYFWGHHLVYFTTVSYQFLTAMTTNYHNIWTLKQQNVFFFFHSSKDQKSNIVVTGLKSICWRAVLPGEVLGENLFLASSSCQRLPGAASIPWPVTTSFQSLLLCVPV